jgi:hypothetical protein
MFTPPAIPRRSKLACGVVLAFIACSSATAAIRQFSIPTIEKLGRGLYVQTQRPQNLTEPQQRAMRAAMSALPKLQKQTYRFVVLRDPEREGYLV